MSVDWRTITDEKEKYSAYLCSREWCEKREAVRKRAGGFCERCSVNPMDAVHHTTYARKYDETLEDLMAICKICHDFIHAKSEIDPGVEWIPEQLSEILDEACEQIEERAKRPGCISGISTGFPDLDNMTNGFQASELVVLAARPSMGKTAFVLRIAECIADQAQAGVAVFSLEQSRLELAERFLCIRGRVDMHKLRKGELDDDEIDKIRRVTSELAELPIFIDDNPRRTVSQIGAICRGLSRNHEIRTVIIDYLQLIEPEERRAPREQQIAQMTRSLKFLAKELAITVVALAQLNRGVEMREDKRPRLADLRESGAIEQDADIVMFLHRPEMYDPADHPGEAELIVAKHRNGPTGIVRLGFKKQYMRFEDCVAQNMDMPTFNDSGF